jgi:pimeloyl-ACP methyl ester carboxylesterase
MKRSTFILRTAVLIFVIIGDNAYSTEYCAQESVTVQSGFIEVDGGKIFYEVNGEGPVIMMIHDGILHRETWDGQFGAFAENYRVIRWDRRGYGRSSKPQASFINCDDLFAVMKGLKIERAAIVGCSSGGLLAMEFAVAHPEMVSSLVLVGPIVSGFGFSEHFLKRGDRGIPSRNAPVEEEIRYWCERDPWILAPASKAARERMKSLLSTNPQNISGAAGFSRPPGPPVRDSLSEIKVPTLIIAGESDMPDVHAHTGVIQAGIEGSKRVVLNHSGHLCHMEVPEVFNEVVLRFLEQVK